MSRATMAAVATCCVLALAACTSDPAQETADRAPVVQLGAPGEENRELSAAEASELEAPSHTAADVEFVRMMIPHHEQALEMTALVPSRTERDDLPLLAERLEISQTDEIEQMRRWLEERGEAATSHQHHSEGHLMPGMLTPEEMSQLSDARGAEFDELFLQYMIRHHEGALAMVAELLATNGAGQETDVFRFASDVDADQRAEIARMRAILEKLPTHAPPR